MPCFQLTGPQTSNRSGPSMLNARLWYAASGVDEDCKMTHVHQYSLPHLIQCGIRARLERWPAQRLSTVLQLNKGEKTTYTYLPQRISKDDANRSLCIEESKGECRCQGRYCPRLDDHPYNVHSWFRRWASLPGSGSFRHPPDTSYNLGGNGNLRRERQQIWGLQPSIKGLDILWLERQSW